MHTVLRSAATRGVEGTNRGEKKRVKVSFPNLNDAEERNRQERGES
jgi:hypothetical protein